MQPQHRGKEVGGVSADHVKLAVGELRDVHHAEDQGQPQRHQGVDAAAHQASDEQIEQTRPVHWAAPF
jgi:hypothetical protein